MDQKNEQPTNQEILMAINDFSTQVEKRFDGLEGRMDGLENKMGGLEGRMDGLENKMGGLEGRMESTEKEIKTIKATMVTKDYFDDKVADLRGDLVIMMRKEDTKLKALVDILHEKKVLSENDLDRILSLEPFAKIV